MSRQPTNLYTAVAQIMEWTYGQTNIEYGISDITFTAVDGEKMGYAFHLETNVARISAIKHPLALVVETVRMSLTGTCVELGNSFVDTGRTTEKLISVEPGELNKFILREDQGGFSNISVQVYMGAFDGGDKTLSCHFRFRGNLLNTIRQR